MVENLKPESLASMAQKQPDPKDEGSKVGRFLERLESESIDTYDTTLAIDTTEKKVARLADAALVAHYRTFAEELGARAQADAEGKDASEVAKAKEGTERAAAAAIATAEATLAARAEEAEKKFPPEERKTIKFTDSGMEDVIQGACWHIDVFGSHVFGHYDLLDPNGDNILPQDWETVIQPDWTITTHMWPIPVNQKDADPAPAGDSQLMRPQLHRNDKKPRRKFTADPFAQWMMGGLTEATEGDKDRLPMAANSLRASHPVHCALALLTLGRSYVLELVAGR
ncbi:hypothetical protein PENNAL_c0009G03401 [Penicillium nalgiovense]|uniref:Ubiquitin-like domain-containing protein n=1 Tax=Penicillium nalgiovense TaxID=60175 RepID=A0A1V6YVR7_PENNA|nr:hypothetical protein PENNAL_c0009G03401 [Penicillium nalgiovense]